MATKTEIGDKTLLSRFEIVKYSGLAKEFPACDFGDVFQIEYNEFCECLGVDFYKDLLKHCVDYSENCEEYDHEKDYPIGAVVTWRGCYKISVKETKGNSPDTKGCWELAPKFDKECLNKFWCKFLAPYLAWVALRHQLPFIANQIKADGVLEMFGFGARFKTVEEDRIHMVMKAIAARVELAFKNMKKYAQTNNGSGCFNKVKFIGVSCCKTCGTCICSCDDKSCDDDKSDTGYIYAVG